MSRDERQWLKTKVDEAFASLKREGVPIWWLKVHGGPMQRAGVPDFVICVGGLFASLELKHPDDDDPQPSPRQRVEMRDIRTAGGDAIVCNSVECAVNYARRLYATTTRRTRSA